MPNTDPNSLAYNNYTQPDRWFKSGTTIQGVGEDPEYDDAIMLSDVIDQPQMLERFRGQQQSGWQQLGRAIERGVKSAPLTALETAADLFDPNTWISLFTGEAVEDNAIAEWARSIKGEIADDNKIYSETGVHDLSDPATRFEILASVIDSGLAFAATGYGVGAAFKGVASAIKTAKSIDGFANAMKAVDTSAHLLAGTAQNIAEGKMVAIEGYNEGKGKIDQQANDLRTKLYQDKLSEITLPATELKVDSESGIATEVLKGTNVPLDMWKAQQNEIVRGEVENEVNMFVKDSKTKLATEMAKVQRWNLMNVASDAFALRGIMKSTSNTITRTDRIKKVAEKLKESVTTPKGLAIIGVHAVGEGVEETDQEILKKEFIAEALDPETRKNTSFGQRLNDYVQDQSVKQAFVAGFFGGPFQSGLTTMASTVGEVWNRKAIDEHNKNVETNQAAARELNNSHLNANMRSTADLLTQKEEAIAKGDEESVFVADRKLFGRLVYNNAVRGTVNTLEEDLNDLAYGKTDEATEAERVKAYGEDYKTRAKDWLNQLAVHEKEFIKAHNASIGKEGLDRNKRALLFTLASRIEDTRTASKNLQDRINQIQGDSKAKELAVLLAKKARLESIIAANVAPNRSVNPLADLEASLQSSIDIMEGRTPTVATEEVIQPTAYKKAQAKLQEVQSKLDDFKGEYYLEQKDIDEITQYGESMVESELLNDHYNSMYVDVKNDKTDLNDAQKKTIDAIRKAHVDYGSAVNTILQNTVPQRPPSNATTVDNNALDQELSVLENEEQRNQVLQDVDRLATAYVENDQETINSPELEYVGEQFTNNLKASIKAKEEEARQKAKLEEFEKRKEATKSTLFSSLENRSEIDEQGIAEYEKLAENRNNAAGLSELIGELNSIRNELLSGATIPDNVNRDVALETVERILKTLKADVENNTNVTYGEVDHYQDHLDSDMEETNQNDEYGHDRKLRAVNAMAYNGTDIEDSMLDFVDYVNDPANNLVGREVQYELPVSEDMQNLTEDEAKALLIVLNSKGKPLSKADLAFVHKNLPIRTTIMNTGDRKVSAWLHSTGYTGYSPAIIGEVTKFNMNQRVQIITNLLAGKKIYTTIKNQRGGYGNRQFWYTKGKDRVIVNTQDAQAMKEFEEAIKSPGSKAKRTPVHNRIGDAVDTIEFKVADSKGEIEGKHTGKKANNIYFKTLSTNGEERYVRAYVRSAKDSKQLLTDVLTSMDTAIANHRTELEAVAKFLNKPLESLTDADVVSTLFNNAEAILLNRDKALSLIEKARMRVDYSQLSNPAYIELLTLGSNPIVYTNMAKFSNNGSKPSLYVQGTVEMDTAYHFKKDVPVTNITPVVDNTVTQSEVDEVLNRIANPTLKKEMKIALAKASKKDLQVLGKALNRQANSTQETLDVLRTLNKLFNTGLTSDTLNSEAMVSLWNEYRYGQMDSDTISTVNRIYGRALIKAFDKFIQFQDEVGEVAEEITEIPVSNTEDSVPHESTISSFNREQRVQILSLLEPFIVGNSTYNEVVNAYAKASEFSGNVTESTAILNELRTNGSELQKEASLYIDSRLNTNKQYPHLSEINSNNSPSVVDETLREAFSKVTNNKGDNANEYLQDALVQSLQDSEYMDLANKVKALSKESFSALQNHYVTTNEEITESVPETVSELDLPITERQSTTVNESRVIFNNRDNIAKQIGRGIRQVVYDTKGEVYEEEILYAFNTVAINNFGDLMYKQYLIDIAYNYGYTELGDALTDQSFGVLNSLVSSSAKTAMNLVSQLGIAHAVGESIQTIFRAYNATGFYANDIKALLPTTNKRYDSKQKSLGNEIWYVSDSNGTDAYGKVTFPPLITNAKGEILSLQGSRKGKQGLVGIYAVTDSTSANAAQDLIDYDATSVYSNSEEFMNALSNRLKSNTPEVSDTEQSETSNHFGDTVDIQVADTVDIEGIRYKITLENNKLYATAEGKSRQPIPPRVHAALIAKLEEDYKKHCK